MSWFGVLPDHLPAGDVADVSVVSDYRAECGTKVMRQRTRSKVLQWTGEWTYETPLQSDMEEENGPHIKVKLSASSPGVCYIADELAAWLSTRHGGTFKNTEPTSRKEFTQAQRATVFQSLGRSDPAFSGAGSGPIPGPHPGMQPAHDGEWAERIDPPGIRCMTVQGGHMLYALRGHVWCQPLLETPRRRGNVSTLNDPFDRPGVFTSTDIQSIIPSPSMNCQLLEMAMTGIFARETDTLNLVKYKAGVLQLTTWRLLNDPDPVLRSIVQAGIRAEAFQLGRDRHTAGIYSPNGDYFLAYTPPEMGSWRNVGGGVALPPPGQPMLTHLLNARGRIANRQYLDLGFPPGGSYTLAAQFTQDYLFVVTLATAHYNAIFLHRYSHDGGHHVSTQLAAQAAECDAIAISPAGDRVCWVRNARSPFQGEERRASLRGQLILNDSSDELTLSMMAEAWVPVLSPPMRLIFSHDGNVLAFTGVDKSSVPEALRASELGMPCAVVFAGLRLTSHAGRSTVTRHAFPEIELRAPISAGLKFCVGMDAQGHTLYYSRGFTIFARKTGEASPSTVFTSHSPSGLVPA